MTIRFAQVIKQNEIITFVDDINLKYYAVEAENKHQTFEQLRIFHEALRNSKLKTALDRTFFFLVAVKFLGYIISQNKVSLFLKTIEAIQQMNQRESKKPQKNRWEL